MKTSLARYRYRETFQQKSADFFGAEKLLRKQEKGKNQKKL